MANQWYIRRGSTVLGPSTSAQLKSDAAEGLVKRDDEVSQSPTGPWTVAQIVKGLFPIQQASAISDEPAGQESSSLKPCPFCAEKIQAAAIKCKHCGEFLSKPQSNDGILDPSKKSNSDSYQMSESDKARIMEEEAFKIKAREKHQASSPLRGVLQIILLIPMLFAVMMFINAYEFGDAEKVKTAGAGVLLIGLLFGATFINRVA